MSIKKFASFCLAIILSGFVFEFNAQPPPPFTTGLNHPTKIITAAGNSLLVSESGTMVPNTGRVSVVDRTSGLRHSLIIGLPSGVSNLGGEPDQDGTTGIYLQGKTLYLVSGVGDAVFNAGGPGLEAPNPAGPSSPIFNSIMEVTLPSGYESLGSGFTMTLADQFSLAAGTPAVLTNAEGQRCNVRMVANLPDYRSEPRPGYPGNVRASHLFDVEKFQKQLYVADAAFNLIYRVDIGSGSVATFYTFPNRPNPLFPFGGPFIEPVPDRVHRVGNRLLVPLLTGFPFAAGLSEVQTVSLKNGEAATLIQGLTSAIDILPVETADGNGYYTLEFSSNLLGGAPGRIRFFDSSGTSTIVAPVLITPTSMARDENTGDIFVTNIFPGTITKIEFP